ncbi:hypothetical protein Esti_002678 [Eimeria stiedai]
MIEDPQSSGHPAPSLAAAAPSSAPAALRPEFTAATAKVRRPAAALAAVAAAAGLGRCHLVSVLTREVRLPPLENNTRGVAGSTRALQQTDEARHLAQQRMQEQPWPRQVKRQRQQQQQRYEQDRGRQRLQGHRPKSPSGTAEASRGSVLAKEHSNYLQGRVSVEDSSDGEARAGVPAPAVLPNDGFDDCDWPRCLNLLEEVWGLPGSPFELYRHLNVEPSATSAEIRKVRHFKTEATDSLQRSFAWLRQPTPTRVGLPRGLDSSTLLTKCSASVSLLFAELSDFARGSCISLHALLCSPRDVTSLRGFCFYPARLSLLLPGPPSPSTKCRRLYDLQCAAAQTGLNSSSSSKGCCHLNSNIAEHNAGPLGPGRSQATQLWISAESQGLTPQADESLSSSSSSRSSSSRSRSSSDESSQEESLKGNETSSAAALLSLLSRFHSKRELLRLTLPAPNCSSRQLKCYLLFVPADCRQQLHCLWQLCCRLRASPVRTPLKLNPVYSPSVGHQTLLNARLWHKHRAAGHASHWREQQQQQQQQQPLEGQQHGCSGWLTSLRSHLARPPQAVSDGFLHLQFLWSRSAACTRQPHEAGSWDRASCVSSPQTRPAAPTLRGLLLSRDAAAAAAGTLAAMEAASDSTNNSCCKQESSGGAKSPSEKEARGTPRGTSELLLLLFAPKKLMPWKDLELLHAASAEPCWCCCFSNNCCGSSSSSSTRCSSNFTLHATYPLILRLQQQSWANPQDLEVSHRPTAQQTTWLLLVVQALLEEQQQQEQQRRQQQKQQLLRQQGGQQSEQQQVEQSLVLDVATPYCIRDSTE